MTFDRRWFVHSRVLDGDGSVGHCACIVCVVLKMLLRFDSSTGFSVNIKINASLVHNNSVMKFSLNGRGSHLDWKNGKAFSSQGILNRLENSGKITQNTGKLREFQTNAVCYFLVLFKCTVYYLVKWIEFSVYKNI